MKKTTVTKMTLTRETLRQMDIADGQLKAPVGGAWPMTTVRPYPCQPSCLCP